jgi:hypothetical protein
LVADTTSSIFKAQGSWISTKGSRGSLGLKTSDMSGREEDFAKELEPRDDEEGMGKDGGMKG